MIWEIIINKYYADGSALKSVLLCHSNSVKKKALQIISKHPELKCDLIFLENAAMLHDIGVFLTNAPSIYCTGKEPYIKHGILGAKLLRAEGYEEYARICERHTGTGITKEQIIEQKLPLPLMDYTPKTIEEKLICYADKFFSKTHLNTERTIQQVEKSLIKYGAESLRRFKEWQEMFR